jgi:hypothetical protein
MNAPIKARARLGPGRRETQTNLAPGYAKCEHQATRVLLLPLGSVHHAKEICTDCDRVLRWLPKPRTIARSRMNAYRLARFAMHEGLSSLEHSFIRDVSGKRKLSQRQQAWIDALCLKYLEGTP